MSLKDDFDALDVNAIRRWISSGQEEHLSLEFKRVKSSDFTAPDDRRHLAEALSGFANADGGLVVWGVGTERRSRAEVASLEYPVLDVASLIARLNEFTGVLVTPRVEGVQHKKVLTSDDAGLAVSFIPASDSGPHMAKSGIDRYLRRHGDRMLPMEHYEVADMFGRRPRARLELEWSIPETGSQFEGRYARVRLRLKNVGRAAAVAPVVTISPDGHATEINRAGLTKADGNNGVLMVGVVVGDGSIAFMGTRELALPPNVVFDLADVLLRFPVGDGAMDRYILCRLAAENAISDEVKIEFSGADLARQLPRQYT